MILSQQHLIFDSVERTHVKAILHWSYDNRKLEAYCFSQSDASILKSHDRSVNRPYSKTH